MSTEWRKCINSTMQLGAFEAFVDPDFPPISSSLDGRVRRSSLPQQQSQEGAAVLCYCKLPAAAKRVQSDGPNYGKFYLSCGQDRPGTRKRRAPVVVTRKESPAVKERSTSDGILSKNPYAKTRTSSSSTSSSPPASPPQRQRCNFFRWDPNGSIGASSSGGGGYDARYSLLAWHHFGIQNNCCLYKNGINSSQIRQGAVGNCWFLSALAVVAEKPYLVHQILPHDTLNEQGCYQVNLCLDGEWKPIIVDSNLPVVITDIAKRSQVGPLSDGVLVEKNSNLIAMTAFCGTPDKQVWPALVEKAYAKAHGSYAQLSGGFIAEGLQDLTGAPTETIIFHRALFDYDELWIKLLSFVESGFIMGVATARGGDGLVGGHAYSLLEVIEVPDSVVGEQSKVTDYFTTSPSAQKGEVDQAYSPSKKRQTIRLVRIRNPWGKREWKGDWSADSERWTAALRDRLGFRTYAKGDGTFFMSYDDMLERFHHLDVAKTRQGWNHQSFPAKFLAHSDPLQSSSSRFSLTTSSRAWAYVSIIQPKKRANTTTTFWYCDVSLLILKRPIGNVECEWTCEASSISGVQRSVTCEVFLCPGYEYCCIPFSCKPSSTDCSFRLVAYSSKTIDVRQVPSDYGNGEVDCTKILHKQLLVCDLKLLYRVSEHGVLCCAQFSGCAYFVALNGAHDSFLSIKLSTNLPDGIVVTFGDANAMHDIPPRTQKIVLVISRNGKLSNATQVEFRYVSSVIPSGKTRHTVKINFFPSAIELSLAGDMLTQPSERSSISHSGGDIIDTYAWIPQVGCVQ